MKELSDQLRRAKEAAKDNPVLIKKITIIEAMQNAAIEAAELINKGDVSELEKLANSTFFQIQKIQMQHVPFFPCGGIVESEQE